MFGWDPKTIHKIPRGGIEHILKCCRGIDDAATQLEGNGGDAAIVKELRACSSGIYEVVKDLPVESK
jgi:hypothetical protein